MINQPKDTYNEAIDDFKQLLKTEFVTYGIDDCLERPHLYTYESAVEALKEYIDAVAEKVKGERSRL